MLPAAERAEMVAESDPAADKPVAALAAALAGARPEESAAALAVGAAEERTEGLSLARALVVYGEAPSASSPPPRSQAAH
mmetsp:Transcript_36781/g.85917  ORF Transcript_36781/g.85917 Transcript_36781/m.85917 type:complete len:80 (+) Transcript_36781:186-425(+)